MSNPTLSHIFLRFLRLGLTSFGGPAMIPYMHAMAVEREGWLTDETFKHGVAVTQLIPGATAMQVAAFVGLRSRGGPGALMAYLGFSLPAFLLMMVLTVLYFTTRDVAAVVAVFKGLQLVITAVILHAAINFARKYLDSPSAWFLACLAGVWLGFKGNPILVMILVCVLAVFLFRQQQPRQMAKTTTVDYAPLRFAALLLAGLVLLLLVLLLLAPDLFHLGLLMVKVDCFAFGGGYVSVPIMLHEVVDVRHWLTAARFMDGVALGQVTPGPIVMTGAFVGYAVAGFLGALVATVTVFSPSLIILCSVTPFTDRLVASPIAWRVLKGSLISLVGLMAAVAVQFGLNIQWDAAEIVVAVLAFLALRLKVDILWVVLGGGVLSAVVL